MFRVGRGRSTSAGVLCRGSSLLLVYGLLQLLARAEPDGLSGRDLYVLARVRVVAAPGLPLRDGESADPHEGDFGVLAEAVCYRLLDRVEGALGLRLTYRSLVGHL